MDATDTTDTKAADVEDLNFTFEDIDEEAFVASVFHESSSTSAMTNTIAATVPASSDFARRKNVASTHNDDLKKKDISKKDRDPYILGTLIVRIVAARDLDAVEKGGGLGNLLFGGAGKDRTSRSTNKGFGTANPYAAVRYGNTTQRTSEQYGTTDPIWPRSEIMYMDVTHPSWENDFDDYLLTSNNNNSTKENVSTVGNHMGYSSTLNYDGSELSLESYQPPLRPILTVAIFHTNQSSRSE